MKRDIVDRIKNFISEDIKVDVFSPLVPLSPKDHLNNSIRGLLKTLSRHKKPLFVINDTSRSTPTYSVLKELSKHLEIQKFRYIVATGVHNIEKEDMKTVLKDIYELVSPFMGIHNPRGNLLYLGETPRKTPVLLNKRIFSFDSIFLVGSVEPHYFAGFTGGRKSLVPGLAGYETIEKNHSLAISQSAQPLRLNGNPVNEDLEDAVGFIKVPVFSLQTVHNNDGKILFSSFGGLKESFEKTVKYAIKRYVIPIKHPLDVVILTVNPSHSSNLYQTHKAMENIKSVLKEGGTMIVVSDCKEGIGSVTTFYEILRNSSSISEAEGRALRAPYRLGLHKVVKMVDILKKYRVIMITELSEATVKNIFMEKKESVEDALDDVLSKSKTNIHIGIFSDASNILPIISP